MGKSSEQKTLTIKKGVFGFNANELVKMKLSDAFKVFRNVPEKTIREAHAEALKLLKVEAKKDPKSELAKD